MRACGTARPHRVEDPGDVGRSVGHGLPSGTVTTGTKVSEVLVPKVSISCCSAS